MFKNSAKPQRCYTNGQTSIASFFPRYASDAQKIRLKENKHQAKIQTHEKSTVLEATIQWALGAQWLWATTTCLPNLSRGDELPIVIRGVYWWSLDAPPTLFSLKICVTCPK